MYGEKYDGHYMNYLNTRYCRLITEWHLSEPFYHFAFAGISSLVKTEILSPKIMSSHLISARKVKFLLENLPYQTLAYNTTNAAFKWYSGI